MGNLRQYVTAFTLFDLFNDIYSMTGEAIISIAYGLDVQPENDPYIDLAEKANEGPVEAVVPGAFLVDMLSFLKYVPAWVPGAGFQKKAAKWKALGQAMIEIPFEATRQNMVSQGSKKLRCQACID